MISIVQFKTFVHKYPVVSKLNLRRCAKHLYSTNSAQFTETTNFQSTDKSNPSLNKNEYYDIVVCGGGMVGTAMALALGFYLFILLTPEECF